MGKILCSTRGGEESYRTQDAAIGLAKSQGDTLIFLYVVDLDFLNRTAGPVVVDVEEELTKMGEFLLLMARERAAEQSVEAETLCGKGRFRKVLAETAQEENVSLIVLGRPAGAKSYFDLADLRSFADQVQTETGVETQII